MMTNNPRLVVEICNILTVSFWLLWQKHFVTSQSVETVNEHFPHGNSAHLQLDCVANNIRATDEVKSEQTRLASKW
jgi:hypothetical protein